MDSDIPDPAFMQRALALAREGMDSHRGGPFGAVVARDGRVVGEGCNQVTSALDPTAHAEVVAIRAACAALGRFELRGCELYTSCEPCPMCLAAMYWARLERIWFASDRAAAARAGFDDELLYAEVALPSAARRLPMRRLLVPEAGAELEAWAAKADKVRY